MQKATLQPVAEARAGAEPARTPAEFVDDWIELREAARLMRTNEKNLRVKDEAGNYEHFPQIARIQIRPNGKLFFLRTQILAWRAEIERRALARCQPVEPQPENGAPTYAPIREELARLTTDPALFRALGIENRKTGRP